MTHEGTRPLCPHESWPCVLMSHEVRLPARALEHELLAMGYSCTVAHGCTAVHVLAASQNKTVAHECLLGPRGALP